MLRLCDALFGQEPIETAPEVELLADRPEDYQMNMLSAFIFPYVQHPTEQIRRVVRALPEGKRQEIFDTYIGERQSKRDRPGRGLEYGYPIQFDIIAGFAEYRDLQRHRMLTQQRQNLSILRPEAQYASLFNHLIRWNMGMNLRELGHFTELRTQKAGHPKYRRICQTLSKLYLKRHPEMAPVLKFVDHNDYDQGITRAEQEARTARKSLASGVFDDMDE